MRRKILSQLLLVVLFCIATACGAAQPGAVEAGQTQAATAGPTSATSAAGGTAPAASTPGVLTALPGLSTATQWPGPLALPATPAVQPVQPAGLPAAGKPATATAAQPAPSLPTPTLDCEDGLRYLSDLTIPDGTLVAAGDAIDKRWQVENSGSCNWNEGYRLRRISGEALGVPGELALYPARSGAQAVIQILFTAPPEPGTYRSAWQAYNPQGEAFGDAVFVEIIVGSGTP